MAHTYHPGRFWATMLVAGATAGLVAAFAAHTTSNRHKRVEIARQLTSGEPSQAPEIFRRYGCAGCHTIPGIAGADGKVGDNLSGLRERVFLAGVANNNADNLVRWIVSPRTFSPNTAMPETGISEKEARDLAAYLYSH